MNHNDPDILERLAGEFPDAFTVVEAVDQPTISTSLEQLLAVMQYLRDQAQYRICLDVLAVDYLPDRPRFELVYHLYNPWKHARIRVKVRAGINEKVPSVTALWPGANWPEREAYDLFGIQFEGHPDLRRIYLPDDWDGHPLRKDYPLTGTRVD
ncbi:MAG: NADH-quinone oxidoreductase subunit C [Sulfobacillus thermosulfidooxidans]|uniref:NADH-quinone oxidoreductase subunit C n=1 Tax=Sulfobacillus thermosulfidooxidans TaxID=28034 RepID=A0A2T2WYF7_SULTH|nr:MAG: NADH-quinone oxidoreductase subunit C [Sulfobacillus thermosulfidooxidans]